MRKPIRRCLGWVIIPALLLVSGASQGDVLEYLAGSLSAVSGLRSPDRGLRERLGAAPPGLALRRSGTDGAETSSVRPFSIERVSVSYAAGAEPNGDSERPSISADGQLVVFESMATNLVPQSDTNAARDIFVYDRKSGTTTLASASSTGSVGNENSWAPAISANGQVVAFASAASDLVPLDTNEATDVFVRNLRSGSTRRVSLADNGKPVDNASQSPSVSAAGEFVAFVSWSDDLVAGDDNGCTDIFVRDRAARRTYLLSRSWDGKASNGNSYSPCISADGRYVAFSSFATNLTPDPDTNGLEDVFLHDRQSGQTVCISKPAGGEANGWSQFPSLRSDGQFAAFQSKARNLTSAGVRHAGAYLGVFLAGLGGSPGLVSISYRREEANKDSSHPSVSGDAMWVAFQSDATNLARDAAATTQVYVANCRDRRYPTPYLVSQSLYGGPSLDPSCLPSMSVNGRWIAFQSSGCALVPNDRNNHIDIFVAENPAYKLPPVLSWAGEPGFERDGVDPNRGGRNSSFSFKVKYADVDGEKPKKVELALQLIGTMVERFAMSAGSGQIRTGKIYSLTTTPGPGQWRYRFEAADDDGQATGPPTEWQVGPIVPARPVLRWTGRTGYSSDGVEPDTGTADNTRFNFRVEYVDHEKDMPEFIQLSIREVGKSEVYGSYPLRCNYIHASPREGITYRAAAKLPAGQYEYRFFARDDDGEVMLPAGGWKRGPTVTGGGGSSLSVGGVTAVPTPKGAEVTFCLSASASVQVHVMNIAGRPVRALCRARGCPAGTNTLTWNARSDSGVAVPNGTYLVEITARAPDGLRARGLTQVRLGR